MPEDNKTSRLERLVQIIAISLAGVAVLAVAGLCVAYFALRVPIFDGSGWVKGEDGTVQYMDYFRHPLRGWQSLEGKQYYFDPVTGEMFTGWLETPEGKYYLSANGVMHTGWLMEDEGKRYLGRDGRLQTGWIDTPQGKFYTDEEGMIRSGWHELEGKTYYFSDNGAMQTGWQTLEGSRYYFGDTGEMATGWLETEEGKYYLNDNGQMQTGWLETDAGLYYLGDSGAMHTGWLTDDTGRYYLQEDGTAATGFTEVNGISRYFMEDGQYIPLVNGWNYLPEDFELNLVEYGGYRVDASCRDALEEMLDACKAAGYWAGINSAYRDYAHQQRIRDEEYQYNLNAGMSSDAAYADMASRVAEVGASEHHTGLGIDLSGPYWWLEEHCWEYGFIRRYPPGKRWATGIIYEPWHYRYVGKEMAKAIWESGLCMEEYFDQLREAE